MTAPFMIFITCCYAENIFLFLLIEVYLIISFRRHSQAALMQYGPNLK